MPQRVGRRPEHVLTVERHNLPAPHTRLVGREQNSTTVRELVLQAPGRLVTLTGTGGCGKTQLALLAASGLVESFADGVWLVELAPVQAPHLVPYAVAAVLGRRERAGEHLTDTLVAHLKTRELLLVLDNCEHVIDACAELAERLLAGCPRVRLLATSRERLRIGAETTWRVPSLRSPDPRATLTLADLLAYPAVQLFVQRAQAVQPDFALRPNASSSMVGICARLEGLPLALELAAARASSLSLPQILERLDDSFRLLVGGSRSAPSRQHTLRATLDWSHALLSVAEQAVFRRLAVFGGGWNLEAAETVCSDPMVPATDVFEVLSHLVDKSLVVAAHEPDRRSRYRLLEPIRQYAWEQLVGSGELDSVAQRHAMYFLAFSEALDHDASVGGPRRHIAIDALLHEYRNLQVVLQWALDTGQSHLGLRLSRALQLPWKERGPYGEALTWINLLLKLPGADAPTPARAVALLTAAGAALRLGDHVTTRALYAEAAPLARELEDPWIQFVALADQGFYAQLLGEYDTARRFWTEGLAVTRASGDSVSEGLLLMCISRLAIYERRYAEGRTGCGQALSMGRTLGDAYLTSLALDALGSAALAQGELSAARAFASECLSQPEMGLRPFALSTLGQADLADKRYADAREHLLESLAIRREWGNPAWIAQGLEDAANLAAHTGQAERALHLAGAVETALETRGIAAYPINRDLRDRWLIPLKKTLSVESVERWWTEGRALSLDEAIAVAETALTQTPTGSPPTAAGDSIERPTPIQNAGSSNVAGLSSREVEVLRLVGQGQSNKEIAAELVLSVRTVERHITNLYAKIDARGKADATAYAFKHGLL